MPTPIETVLSRLKGVRRSGGGFTARCPSHDDQRASLSIGQDGDGRVLIHCHAGCGFPAVVAALGLEPRDLRPERSNGLAPPSRRRPVATYDYVDTDGHLRHQTVRYEPKQFKQRRPDERGGWIWNLDGVEPLLYRLPHMIEAVSLGKQIVIVEGEKHADALASLGFDATSAPMGADAPWLPSYTETLRGASSAVILPDHDAAGERHAVKVSRALHGAVGSLKIVRLPGLSEHGDVLNWLAAGGTRDQLQQLIDSASEWQPTGDALPAETQWEPAQESERLPRFQFESDAVLMASQRPDEIIEDTLSERELGALYGPPEMAKSFVAIGLGYSVVTGTPIGDRRVLHPGPVVYVAAEGGGGIGPRLRAWREVYGWHQPADLHFLREPVNLMDATAVREFVTATRALPIPPKLVILDTLSWCLIAGDENLQKDMTVALDSVRRIRDATGAAVLLLHHTNASGERERGSTVLRGALDVMILAKKDGDRVVLTCEKRRDAPRFPALDLRLVRAADSAAVRGAEPGAAPQMSESQRNLLEVLGRCFDVESATATNWREAAGMQKRTFFSAKAWLTARGYATREGTERQPRFRISPVGLVALSARGAEEVQGGALAPG